MPSLTTKLSSIPFICLKPLFFPPTSKSHLSSTNKSPWLGIESLWSIASCEAAVSLIQSIHLQKELNNTRQRYEFYFEKTNICAVFYFWKLNIGGMNKSSSIKRLLRCHPHRNIKRWARQIFFAILSAVADVENAGIEVEISLMGEFWARASLS